ISTKAKGFLKIVPFLFGIMGGYIVACLFGLVNFQPIVDSFSNGISGMFQIPAFALPFKLGNLSTYNLYFGPEIWAIVPIAFVTISEHIGDHTVLSQICGKKFLMDPGLDKTLTGDGIATFVSALIGGPANTTYGENTGVIGLTKIGSVYVILGAASFAIIMSFFTPLTALIQSIPTCVLGGMSVILFGVIASNGLRVLVDAQVDFSKQRNLIIASAMLVLGLGGAVLQFSTFVSLQGMALSALVGIVLNLVLPKK
ncbi:MAG: solute carrier family 23 protein, partial [Erysipelotrichaceae bacterium]